MSKITLRQAVVEDADAIATLVSEAYGPYIARIGREPAPMLDDYQQVVREDDVFVATLASRIVGLLVMRRKGRELLLVNVAVLPACKGQGIGRTLMDLCEAHARAAGCEAIRLYTHERMTENIAIYARLGYHETHRAAQDGFERVFMRKSLL
ncbi:GNAT family N-acetyltransferase [Pseudomonas sp. zfem004]|uniref:GNAT family N-acetyltransferase n=1 Tax=Pseudomonas sp. zfem004 TaxID=3078199 RepID=UPI002927CA06|nr:GNAT family N-acetyltransferase [Pseudomonas sp. zfem004]MDU9402749.1 GNAT family N-acetyltransferase [Pseudomonas sp. zfem004]